MKYMLICCLILLINCQHTGNLKGTKKNITKNETYTNIASSSHEPTFQDEQKEFALLCNKELDIDTSFRIKNQTFNLIFKYYCLFDTLIIPSKYSWENPPKVFYAHNFASNLLIISGEDTLVNTVIKKHIFNRLLDNDLVKYGVLLYPTYRGFNLDKNIIQIHYSISIPLTDVGIAVLLNIKLNGKFTTSAE